MEKISHETSLKRNRSRNVHLIRGKARRNPSKVDPSLWNKTRDEVRAFHLTRTGQGPERIRYGHYGSTKWLHCAACEPALTYEFQRSEKNSCAILCFQNSGGIVLVRAIRLKQSALRKIKVRIEPEPNKWASRTDVVESDA